MMFLQTSSYFLFLAICPSGLRRAPSIVSASFSFNIPVGRMLTCSFRAILRVTDPSSCSNFNYLNKAMVQSAYLYPKLRRSVATCGIHNSHVPLSQVQVNLLNKLRHKKSSSDFRQIKVIQRKIDIVVQSIEINFYSNTLRGHSQMTQAVGARERISDLAPLHECLSSP